MKVSDRDKKLILIVLIAVIVALPYLFVIKPYTQNRQALEAENATLQARLTELEAMNANRADYEKGIVNMNAEIETITKSYSEDILKENTIMFLRDMELGTPIHDNDPETPEETPVFMESVSFAGTVVTPLKPGTVDEQGNVTGAVDGLKSQVSVAYVGDYQSIKAVLAYILNENNQEKELDRLVISAMDINYDAQTGRYTGNFVLDQFAITGDDRELEAAKIPSMNHGNESIFGTHILDEELKALMEEEAGEEESEAEEE